MSENGGSNSPWAWLGLLKWSLSYTDGTRPSSDSPKPMSDEDKAFLESVMKEGIIDEGERMKTILTDVTNALERMKNRAEGKEGAVVVVTEETKGDKGDLDEDDINELLQELRDIVEQIDYARAFSAMGGVRFLLGCASETDVVPRSVRSSCLGVLATLCQNNPPVQDSMLNLNSVGVLADLFFSEFPSESSDVGEADGMLRGKIVQALGCSIRGHAVAEEKFCQDEAGRKVIESGLGLHTSNETFPEPPMALRKRCLFFLHALITSDTSDAERVKAFEPCIRYVASNFLDPLKEPEFEIREMGLELLGGMMEQKKKIDAIIEMKGELVGLGIRRIKEIREMEGEEREFAGIELERWESLIVYLARADTLPEQESNGGGVNISSGNPGEIPTPLLLGGGGTG